MRTKLIFPAILGAALAASGAVAGATAAHAQATSAAQARSAKTAREYVACTTPAVTCAHGRGMQVRPTSMGLSADGSLYVTGIRWHGWGTGKATGTGTAHADNCDPNCAQGSYRTHPATIVFTTPKPWDGKLAYAKVTESVPAIKWHYTFTQGLIP
jgi:hypothetical protein